MHHFVTAMLHGGAFWDMGLMHCWIWELGQLYHHDSPESMKNDINGIGQIIFNPLHTEFEENGTCIAI